MTSVVSQYSFGHDDDLLGDPDRASSLRAHLSELLLGVKFNQHFPWIVDMLETLPMALAKHIMPPGVLDMKEFSTVSFHSPSFSLANIREENQRRDRAGTS